LTLAVDGYQVSRTPHTRSNKQRHRTNTTHTQVALCANTDVCVCSNGAYVGETGLLLPLTTLPE